MNCLPLPSLPFYRCLLFLLCLLLPRFKVQATCQWEIEEKISYHRCNVAELLPLLLQLPSPLPSADQTREEQEVEGEQVLTQYHRLP